MRSALIFAGFVSLVVAVLTDSAAAAVKLTVPQATRTNAAEAKKAS